MESCGQRSRVGNGDARMVVKYLSPQSVTFEESFDRLPYIFATKETLSKCGFPVIKRYFTSARRFKAERYKHLVNDLPELYGKVGKKNWIKGLLIYLNEPTVLAWEDVTEWLKIPDVISFFNEPPNDAFKNIKLVPFEQGALENQSIAKLKLCMVKLERLNLDSVTCNKGNVMEMEIDESVDDASYESHRQNHDEQLPDLDELAVESDSGEANIAMDTDTRDSMNLVDSFEKLWKSSFPNQQGLQRNRFAGNNLASGGHSFSNPIRRGDPTPLATRQESNSGFVCNCSMCANNVRILGKLQETILVIGQEHVRLHETNNARFNNSRKHIGQLKDILQSWAVNLNADLEKSCKH